MILPDVEVRLRAPVVCVNPFEAVKVCADVREPRLLVKSPLRPILKVEALVPAIVTVPPVVPDPASIVTPPPTDVAPPSSPPRRDRVPPV